MAHQTTTAHWQLNVDVKPQGSYINQDLISLGFLLVQCALSVRASLEVGETPFDERAPLPFSERNFVTNWKAQPKGGPGLIDAQEEQYLTRTKARHVTLLTCFAAISLVFVFYNYRGEGKQWWKFTEPQSIGVNIHHFHRRARHKPKISLFLPIYREWFMEINFLSLRLLRAE